MVSWIFNVLKLYFCTLIFGSLDRVKYRPGTRYITNTGFSTSYDLEEILVDSSSTHLYWKTLNWVYAPLIEKGCVDLLSIRDSCGC